MPIVAGGSASGSTLGDLTDECLSYLYGFGASKDKVATLTGAIGATDLSFTVDDGRQIDRGMVEIESEIIAVSKVDPTTGICTVPPWGRGMRGTTASAHATNLAVWDTPRFPRSKVKSEITEVINYLYPDLFAVGMDESQTATPAIVTYPLPAAAESVIRIQYATIGPSKVWQNINRYRVDYNADTTGFPTGKTVDIYQGMAPGRVIKIMYRQKFGQLVNETDTFASANIDENYRDIIRLRVVARMLMSMDAARIEIDTLESNNRGQYTQPTQAVAIARQYLALADQRVMTERKRLLMQYPTQTVRMS